jgi:hypothetical protein
MKERLLVKVREEEDPNLNKKTHKLISPISRHFGEIFFCLYLYLKLNNGII